MELLCRNIFNLKIICLLLLTCLHYYECVETNRKPCITPNGKSAYCESQFSCNSIISAFASRDPTALKFAKESFCGLNLDGTEPLVCCGEDYTYAAPSTEATTKIPDKKSLLPSKAICGRQQVDNRIESRPNTQIDEFPWQAALFYSVPRSSGLVGWCTGVIISKRYILTTSRCVRQEYRVLSFVRLGEYDSENNGRDCVENPTVDECNEPYIDIKVDGSFIFNPSPEGIGLVRLEKDIKYWSDYIRPICLPIGTHTMEDAGQEVFLSGWGSLYQPYYDSNNPFPVIKKNIKKKIHANIVPTEQCNKIKDPNITSTICIRGENLEELLINGDTGGPIISFDTKTLQWYVVGLLLPGDNPNIRTETKVSAYADYILDNLKP